MLYPFWGFPNIPISPLPMEIDYHMSDYGFCMRLLSLLQSQQNQIKFLSDEIVKLGGNPVPPLDNQKET